MKNALNHDNCSCQRVLKNVKLINQSLGLRSFLNIAKLDRKCRINHIDVCDIGRVYHFVIHVPAMVLG